MPVLVTDKGRLECPTFVCDHCGTPIEDAKDGSAEWVYTEGVKGPQSVPVYFIHKKCVLPFTRRPDAPGRVWHNQELDVFLAYLANGVKLDWESAQGRAAMLGQIGL